MPNEQPDYDALRTAIRTADPRLATVSNQQIDELILQLISPSLDLIADLLVSNQEGTELVLRIATHPAVRKEVVRTRKALADSAARNVTIAAASVQALEQMADDPTTSDSVRQDLTQHLAVTHARKTILNVLQPLTKAQRKEVLKNLPH